MAQRAGKTRRSIEFQNKVKAVFGTNHQNKSPKPKF